MPDYEPTDKVCGTCKYYEATHLECRYDPPTADSPRWPTVSATEWCGKYEHGLGIFGTQHQRAARGG